VDLEMSAKPASRAPQKQKNGKPGLRLVRPARDVPPSQGTEKLDAESRLLRSREDRRLLLRYHEHGDQAAREELVERFLPLARQLARRYQRTNEPLDDLMQVASVGLVKAIDRFDPSRGTAFSTYAVPTILGELKRYFRDSGWAVHVPRGMQERVMKLDTAAQELHRKLGRSPSPKELAGQLECSEEEVLEAMEAASAYDAVSLEQQRSDSDNGTSSDTFQDKLGTEEERYELVEYGATIAPTLKALSARERLILHLRFVEDLTQSEIADRIGVSQMHVSRLIRRSLARLRTVAEHDRGR
jgi:RNA polymerase sigma-B factor